MTKNRVTIEEVRENMKDVLVRTVVEFGKPTTYVAVRMENGFTVRASTTCVDPANYNEEIGKDICLNKIEDKIWMLLGYELQSSIVKNNDKHKADGAGCGHQPSSQCAIKVVSVDELPLHVQQLLRSIL